MRTCMYCGKELADGEKCDCYMSRQRRGEADTGDKGGKDERTSQESGSAKGEEKKEKRSRYKTEYSGKNNPFDNARERYKAKKEARKNSVKPGFWSDLWQYIVSSVKNPIDTVNNPPHVTKGALLIIAAAAGAVLWLSAFFITRGRGVGPIRIVASFMGFGEGWQLNLKILAAILSGALGGIVMFFIYTGVFYLINKLIIRMQTPYWQFCERIVTAWIPVTIICLLGAAISSFSVVTLRAIMMCGGIALAALTYEGLKTEWITASAKKVFLSMLLGYFIIINIAMRIVFI